jgi:NitT/TauT family transport system substrate-binding protein
VVLAAFQQHKVRIIATFTTSEKHENMLARKDRGITGPRDLAGKKVAVVPGTSSAYVMAAMLQRNGLEPSELTIISLKPPDMVAAIVRGDVDAIFTWQPHIYNAQKLLGENALVVPSNDIYDSPFNVVVLDTSDAPKIQALRHLIAGLRAAAQYMQANRRECVEIVAKKIGTDVATVDNLWDQYSYLLTLSPSLVDQLVKEGAWAKSAGIVTADSPEPAYSTLVDRRIFDQNQPQ